MVDALTPEVLIAAITNPHSRLSNGGRSSWKNLRSPLLAFGLLAALPAVPAHEPVRARTPVRIPDIAGYRTLKCDFHIHTVFSDGKVWPDVRSEEAWREGLDAIAITDHIEYLPHKDDLPVKHNRAFEIAKPAGQELRLTVIRGSEITRAMPPGHLNAIFLKSSEPLDTKEWRDAVVEAHGQGAFIFWNHPGWTGQQADGVAKWYAEHTELLDQRRLHGIEVVNARDYYPEAHRWCLEKKLTMLSNSDIHAPLNLDYEVHAGDHRPLTLVFARDSSEEAIKEALFARRTAVYSGCLLVGEEQFLKPIFDASVSFVPGTARLRGKTEANLQIHNWSEIPYRLKLERAPENVTVPAKLTLAAGKTVLFEVQSTQTNLVGERSLAAAYAVTNLLVAPETPLRIELRFNAEFAAP